jgi:hypothetical protein
MLCIADLLGMRVLRDFCAFSTTTCDRHGCTATRLHSHKIAQPWEWAFSQNKLYANIDRGGVHAALSLALSLVIGPL